MTVLSQLIPSNYCLSCKGCCRFKEPVSPWRPKVYLHEKELLGRAFVSSDVLDEKRCIKTKTVNGEHFCVLLDEKTNKCTAYDVRPFECELYPFIFVKKQGEVFLAVHLACPFVQENKDMKEFKEYCRALEDFFAQICTKDFLRKINADIYSGHILKDEIEIISPILLS